MAFHLELDAHLSLVAAARRLQPQNLMSLDDMHLNEVIEQLAKAKVKFHGGTFFLLVKRRAQKLTDTLMSATEPSEIKAGIMKLLGFMDPLGQGQRRDFNVFDPALADIDEEDCPHKVDKFQQLILKEFFLTMVTGGEEKSAMTRIFVQAVCERFSNVVMFRLQSSEAGCISDMLDVARAMVGLTGDFEECLQYQKEISALKDAFGTAVSNSFLALAAQAVMRNEYYKQKADDFAKAQPALEVVLPLIHERLRALKDEEGDQPGALLASASLLISHESTVPPNTFLAHNELVLSTAKAYHATLMEEFAMSSQEGAIIPASAYEKLVAWGAVVRELSLAFPMAQWAHDLNEEVGSGLRSAHEANFNNDMLAALSGVTKHFEEQKCQLTSEKLVALNSVMSKATAKHHFKGRMLQQSISECIGAFEHMYEHAFDENWSEAVPIFVELNNFLQPKCKLQTSRLEILQAAGLLRRSVTQAMNIINDNSWKIRAKDVLQRRAVVEELLQKLPPHEDEAMALADMLKSGAQKIIGLTDEYINNLKDVVKAPSLMIG